MSCRLGDSASGGGSPDDESFGLGAIISQMAAAGAAVHILCYTHGEASTLNENHADLDTEREAELRHASTELAAASLTPLGYPDGGLAAIPPPALAGCAPRPASHSPGNHPPASTCPSG